MKCRKCIDFNTTIVLNASVEGEPIEHKIERILNNGEPITDGSPLIYTERKDGVLAGYDIRTDRFDVAIDAMEKVAQVRFNERKMRIEKGGKNADDVNGDSVKTSD